MRVTKYYRFLVLLGLALVTPLCSGAEVAHIHMSPGGHDDASGLSPNSPVATLQRALAIVQATTAPPGGFQILVAPGEYRGQQTSWSGLPDESSVEILGPTDAGQQAVFDGAGRGGTWFFLRSSAGRRTPVTIAGLEIRNYATAISFNGNRLSDAGWNGGAVIRDNVFRNIGSVAAPSRAPSTAAIRLVNSRGNRIERNRFITIRNITRCGLLHSIYLAHLSTNNIISDNWFEDGCGSTIKVRDSSGENVVERNTFVRQEAAATLDDHFCNRDVRGDCTKQTAECPSWNNHYRANTIILRGMSPSAASRLKSVRAYDPETPAGCDPARIGAQRIVETGTQLR